MRGWCVVEDRDGFRLQVYEVPVWSVLVAGAVEQVDVWSGCRLCGAQLPEWVWRVGAGGVMWRLFGRGLNVEFGRRVVRHDLRLSDEAGRELWGRDPLFDD